MFNLEWLEWSNPVSFWWVFLVSVSLLNISFWIFTYIYLRNRPHLNDHAHLRLNTKTLVWLSFLYVIVCAFRSVLPRADVQRICLFDTWFSSVFIGRSVATVAELAFIAQWAIVIYHFAKITHSQIAEAISKTIVPLILVAECFS